MQLDVDTLAVQSFVTSAAEPKEPVNTINTGPGGEYTLCFICTTYPVDGLE